jgi:hypothetical protein
MPIMYDITVYPDTGGWRTTAESANHAVSSFKSKIRDLVSNKDLSPAGHRKAILKAAEDGPKTFLANLRSDVEKERRSLAERREHFQLDRPSRDVADVINRQEIRTWLRSRPLGERLKHAASNPVIAEAVLEMPAALSGLNDEGQARARDFLLDHKFGAELRTIDAEIDVIEKTASIIGAAENDLRLVTEDVVGPLPFGPRRDGDGNMIMKDGAPIYEHTFA